MSRSRSRLRGLRRTLFGVLGLLLLVVAGPARPAAAHAELLVSEPAAGAVLESSPAVITLTFSEPVEISLGALRLFDGSGDPILIGATEHVGGDAIVEVEVPVLQRGSYVVSWRALSADSHPISGAFIFQIGSASTLGPDVLEQVASTSGTNDTAATLLGLTRGLVIAAMAVLGGGAAAVALGCVGSGRRLRRAMLAAAFIGGGAGLLGIPLEAAYVSGSGLDAIVDPDAWRAMLETRLGVAWLLRALALYFGGLALVVAMPFHTRRWWQGTVAALLVVLGLATAYGGHGATGRWSTVGILATTVHVVAMAVWIGGLVALLIGLGEATAQGIRRFSAVAIAAAGSVVLTGFVQSVRQLERTRALVDTDYGRLLLAKVFAVAVVLGFAATSRMAAGGRLLRVRPAASVGAAGDLDRPTLARSVRAELLFAVAAIVLTASLTGANPNAAAAAEPFSTTVISDDYLASIAIDPARIGPNQLHLYLSSPGGSLSRPDSVTVTMSESTRQVAPIEVPVFPVGANHFQALSANFPFAGTWVLEIRAVYDTFSEVVFTAEVPID